MSQRPPHPQADWAWFFDIDGTLASIAAAPDMVSVDPQMRALIARLSELSNGALALISGRSIANIDLLFAGLHLPVAGQHGAERRAGDGMISAFAAPLQHIALIRTSVEQLAREHAGLLVEDKGMSLAVHYRQAPALEELVREHMRAIHARFATEFVLQLGKCVVEILPLGVSKGDAVRSFMREAPFEHRVPIFIGDDVTDEDAFVAVNAMDGVSIKVGSGVTHAHFCLADVKDVQRWLSSEGVLSSVTLSNSRENATVTAASSQQTHESTS